MEEDVIWKSAIEVSIIIAIVLLLVSALTAVQRGKRVEFPCITIGTALELGGNCGKDYRKGNVD